MKKNLVVTIGGASNSLVSKSLEIVSCIQQALKDFKDVPVELRELSSLGNRHKTNEWFGKLNPNEYESLVVISKSLGSIRLHQAYAKHRNQIDKFKRVSLVFIDAHSPLPNYYGRLRGFTVKNVSKNVHGWSVYQHKSKPYGARLKFKGLFYQHEIMEDSITHFNIISHQTTELCIIDALDWAFFAKQGMSLPQMKLMDSEIPDERHLLKW